MPISISLLEEWKNRIAGSSSNLDQFTTAPDLSEHWKHGKRTNPPFFCLQLGPPRAPIPLIQKLPSSYSYRVGMWITSVLRRKISWYNFSILFFNHPINFILQSILIQFNLIYFDLHYIKFQFFKREFKH